MAYTCMKIQAAAAAAAVWIMQINAPSAQQETGFVQICIFICWRNALALARWLACIRESDSCPPVRSSARHLHPHRSSSPPGSWRNSSQLIYLAMHPQRHYTWSSTNIRVLKSATAILDFRSLRYLALSCTSSIEHYLERFLIKACMQGDKNECTLDL